MCLTSTYVLGFSFPVGACREMVVVRAVQAVGIELAVQVETYQEAAMRHGSNSP
jgi:hypothetical protein